jgi:hypothetical protein
MRIIVTGGKSDPGLARALWKLSAELTGCDWRRR